VTAIALDARSQEARRGAEFALVRLLDPVGLTLIRRRLAAAAAPAGQTDKRFEVQSLIGDVASYGAAARDAGPLVVRYLDSSYHPDLRAAAALAVGRIDYRASTGALMALQPEFADDWLIAYNAAESLGRLRAAEARPLLERLRREHWHSGVRNNAERALNAIVGGAFARAGTSNDTEPHSVRDTFGEEYVYFGGLRHGADGAARCSADGLGRSSAATDGSAAIPWPSENPVEVAFDPIPQVRTIEIRRRLSQSHAPGRLQAILPVRSGHLVAFNGGEFGGGLHFVPKSGPPLPLLHAPVWFMWTMDGRLYAATGLSHGVLDSGELVVVSLDRLTVDRAVRLPAHPDRLIALNDRSVLLSTPAGAVGVSWDGRLYDAARHPFCRSRGG
jgi:hypothetical protein